MCPLFKEQEPITQIFLIGMFSLREQHFKCHRTLSCTMWNNVSKAISHDALRSGKTF